MSGKFNSMSNRSFTRDGNTTASYWTSERGQFQESGNQPLATEHPATLEQSALVLGRVDIIYPLPYQSTSALVLGDTGSWLTVFWDMHCGHT